MANGNTVTIVGNLTRDPELRFTPTGQANVRFGVAVNRRWQDKSSGEWQEAVSFFDVVAWRELAENVAESMVKGSRIMVMGRLEQRSYETQQGEKRNVCEIIADDLGPSLRFANVQITKTERRSGGEGQPISVGASSSGTSGAPSNVDSFGDEPF